MKKRGRAGSGQRTRLGNITYITETLAEVMNKSQAELLGTPFFELFAKPEDGVPNQRTLPFMLAKQCRFNDLKLKAVIGEDDRWWSISGKPQLDKSGEFVGYRGNGKDITAQQRSEEESSRLAMFDSLTGLANRTSASKTLASTLSTFKQQKRTCGILLVDLDRFKQVNDTMGHLAGDELLKQVAKRLLKAVGTTG